MPHAVYTCHTYTPGTLSCREQRCCVLGDEKSKISDSGAMLSLP